MSACLKTEELRWGSPTATTPFATLDFAPKVGLNEIFRFSEFNGQFDGFGWLTAGKLTDLTEGIPVPELAEGAALLCPQ